jgi:nitrogen regulatory protein P-II 1
MKLITAVIRPERLEAVEEALRAVLDEGDNYRLTVQPVEGHGRQEGEVEFFRGHQVRSRKVPKLRLSIGVNDEYLEKTIEALMKGARTPPHGAIGDGKIFVVELQDVVRIRTGERGQKAI